MSEAERAGASRQDRSERLLAGRYRLGEVLGRGGMGTVWRAQDETLGRTVAVKELRFPGSIDDEEKRRLITRTLREAKAIARIRNNSAVTVFDVVDEDDRPWIVMELVEGKSLAEVIREDGLLTPQRAAEVGLAILDVLRVGAPRGHPAPRREAVQRADRPRTAGSCSPTSASPRSRATRPSPRPACSSARPPTSRRSGPAGTSPGPPADLWSLGGLLYASVEGVPAVRQGLRDRDADRGDDRAGGAAEERGPAGGRHLRPARQGPRAAARRRGRAGDAQRGDPRARARGGRCRSRRTRRRSCRCRRMPGRRRAGGRDSGSSAGSGPGGKRGEEAGGAAARGAAVGAQGRRRGRARPQRRPRPRDGPAAGLPAGGAAASATAVAGSAAAGRCGGPARRQGVGGVGRGRGAPVRGRCSGGLPVVPALGTVRLPGQRGCRAQRRYADASEFGVARVPPPDLPPRPVPRAPLTDVVPQRTLVIIAVVVALAVLGTVLALTLGGGDDDGSKGGKSGGGQGDAASSAAPPSTKEDKGGQGTRRRTRAAGTRRRRPEPGGQRRTRAGGDAAAAHGSRRARRGAGERVGCPARVTTYKDGQGFSIGLPEGWKYQSTGRRGSPVHRARRAEAPRRLDDHAQERPGGGLEEPGAVHDALAVHEGSA